MTLQEDLPPYPEVVADSEQACTKGGLVGKNIAVVGMSFAPEPTGIAPYTTGMAMMLLDQGAHIDVIAGVPHYPAWRMEPEDRWRLRRREVLDGLHVQRARHHVPRRQSLVGRLAWEGTFLMNAGLVRPSRSPDLVIGITPSLSGSVVAARLAARHRARLVIVVQDLMGQAAVRTGLRGASSMGALVSKVERYALRRADRVAVISQSFRRQMTAYGVAAERVVLLPNWTHIPGPRGLRADLRRQLGWPDDVFIVLHTGNMGLKQGLDNVLEAARRLGDRRDVRFVLLGDGNQRRLLAERARDIATLEFRDPVDNGSYADVLQAADLLLVNELPTVGEMSLPSKLTSYFFSGQPVLAAVSDDGGCADELLRSGGAGIRVEPGDPAALLEAVDRLRAAPEQRAAMGFAGSRHAIRSLGRAAAERAVVALVQDALTDSRRVLPPLRRTAEGRDDGPPASASPYPERSASETSPGPMT